LFRAAQPVFPQGARNVDVAFGFEAAAARVAGAVEHVPHQIGQGERETFAAAIDNVERSRKINRASPSLRRTCGKCLITFERELVDSHGRESLASLRGGIGSRGCGLGAGRGQGSTLHSPASLARASGKVTNLRRLGIATLLSASRHSEPPHVSGGGDATHPGAMLACPSLNPPSPRPLWPWR